MPAEAGNSVREFMMKVFAKLVIVRFIGVSVLLSLLLSCGIRMPDDPNFAPVAVTALRPPEPLNGAIYRKDFGVSLFGDERAHRIGDIITVILSESTVSSKSAEASASKKHAATLGGATHNGVGISGQLDSERTFEGDSEADQSNSLKGNITVSVADILPNGILKIRGEKWITLTRGSELIRISGLIRPMDITPDNTVLSTKLADARITYAGKGELADSTSQGWLTRILHSPWMPF